MSNVDRAKQDVRERVWALLEQERAAPAGVRGHIPTFVGTDEAAEQLSGLAVWHAARVVKSVPDRAQQPVRARALAAGKLVYMAVPKLAEIHPFYALDPIILPVPTTEAAKREVAAQVGKRIDLAEMRPVDIVVCGSVAVNRYGARLGKGAGYSDIEVALLQEAGLIGPHTAIVTTVHPLQVVNDDLPETDHDFRVDLIVTPNEVIEGTTPKRPRGLTWQDLSREKIAEIPVLADLWSKRQTGFAN